MQMETDKIRIEKDPKKFDWSTVGLDFGNWEEEKLWALELPTEKISIQELLWLFEVPFWENDSGARYVVTPWDVINGKEGATKERMQVEKADLSYPIDIFKNHGKWLVLDGLHRLVKAHQLGIEEVEVRVVPRDKLPDIASDHPIELPQW